MNSSDNRNLDRIVFGSGYPTIQLAKALQASVDADAGVRERAQARITRWVQVVRGVHDGSIAVGSRTPIDGTPAWMTLEVMTGGFATGNLVAAGPLLPFELELLGDRLPASDIAQDRKWLNSWYLSEEGLNRLLQQLDSGCFEIAAPEEGALLAFAWLVNNKYMSQAGELLDTISPYFDRVRFYPRPASTPVTFGERVFLRNVAQVSDDLGAVRPNDRLLAQREAIDVWQPLYDRTVALFVSLIDGEVPRVRVDPAGAQVVSGGFLAKNLPDLFLTAANEILDAYDQARKKHTRCNRPLRKDNFAQLRVFLRKSIKQKSLLDSDALRIRLLLARYITRRGLPDSSELLELRKRQQQQIDQPIYAELAKVMIGRLKAHPSTGGVDDCDAVSGPTTEADHERFGVPSETTIPDTLIRKLRRCARDTADALIEQGIITSGDTLAEVLPQMTSGLRAAGIRDTSLRRLYASIDRAFTSRRSLLLLNLQSQVRLEELPWIQAINQFRAKSLSGADAARASMKEIVRIALSSFPFAILPNKLLTELRGLSKAADVKLPLVDELAADIFMGAFSPKFVEAAKISAELLGGSLYARYYGIDFDTVAKLPAPSNRHRSGDAFAAMCAQRAGTKLGGWTVVGNGKTIEQQQIITTQNLAATYVRLDLAESLDGEFYAMAESTLKWILRRLQLNTTSRHASLISVKNSAYAWRQLVFYLSLVDTNLVLDFCESAQQLLLTQSPEFESRFRPVLNGLEAAVRGQKVAQPFVGWVQGSHPLL